MAAKHNTGTNYGHALIIANAHTCDLLMSDGVGLGDWMTVAAVVDLLLVGGFTNAW